MNLKNVFKKSLLLLIASVLSLGVYAQTRSVSGVVKDASGEPMIGVSVTEKGNTSNGAITDLSGKFTVSNLKEGSILEFSYIGFTTQEVRVGAQNTLDVVLAEDQQALDEVVVIGYGTVKRRDLTGSVASITGETLAANPVTNIVQALQGQLPGVNVISQDGRPGATMSVRVRGGGSITQSNEPLFVVDGVVVSDISVIPADNIERIDVLKDAATTAIYGARGANGVILVTTKSASGEAKTQVKYNGYFQLKENPNVLDVMDAYDYVLWNWSYATSYSESYGTSVAKYFGLGSTNGNNLNKYKDVQAHNYVNDLMRTAYSWNHDLSLSGGNAATKYYATVNYADDQGIRIKSDFKRWNANFKINHQISKKLAFNADFRYSQRAVDGTQFGMATSVYSYRPVDTPFGDDNSGLFANGSGNVDPGSNPIDNIANYFNITKRERFGGNGALIWDVIKGLTAKTELALNRNFSETKYFDAGNPTISPYSRATLTKGDGYGARWTNTLNYELQNLGEDHSASVMLGHEMNTSNSSTSTIDGYGYPEGFTMDNAFGMLNMTGNSANSEGKDVFNNSIGTPENSMSWFGRANYSYKERYLLTATFRSDGSSRFAPNNHWGYFPAAAAAWRISEESFLEDVKWISNLKLRLSYGTVGADNISSSLWLETWKTSTIQLDGKPVTVYIPGDMLQNDDLKWETTTTRNLGIDYGFLKNKFRGSIDFYWNTTSNLLMKVPTDASTGYSYQFQNVGQTSNKGVEFAFNADIYRNKNWRLSANLTYNFNQNNVDELIDGVLVDTRTGWGSSMTKPSYDYVIKVGKPVGLIQGFKSNGFYTVDDFNYDASTGVYTLKSGVADTKDIINYSSETLKGFKRADGQNAFPGMVKFEDTNNDGVINDDDKTIIGEAQAKHTGGFNLNAGYKNLDFSLNFVYQLGGKIYNANAMHSMMGNKDSGLGNNRLAFIKDTYRVYDVDANGDIHIVTEPTALNALNANAKYALNYNEYGLVSSQFIEDASYLRLQNLTLGYTLPRTLLSKLKIASVRLYFTGSNLFCLNNYSGIDPDVNTQPGGVDGFPTPNYDYNSYPKARTYTFGLNITF
jgi:TonB-linked SusC/RagA family outer membrane protein